ncbi:hypothetical protein GCM10023187_09360 [Nibrella viscosa]|uniref:Histidine Kinase domain-containing protein n=1 Tax=Nibrella viscosa TaxID=1084524 RepID=A0ABP8K020_9BACT
MDARKIQFLIGIQREIDKLEEQEGQTDRIERLKSRFYDVVEVEEIVEDKTNQDIVQNQLDQTSESKRKFSNDKDYTKYCPHQPKYVTEFLKNFRRVNETGLRELVHPPYNEEGFDLRATFNKIENELFPSERDYTKFSRDTRIPYWLWVHIRKDLMDVYTKYGLSYWDKNQKHPLFEEATLTRKVQEFIKSIRFGNDSSVETHFRETLIPSILNDLRSQFENTWLSDSTIHFNPDFKKFDSNMVIMTDVRRIKDAIKSIFRLIIQKSNWKGEALNDKNFHKKKVNVDSVYKKNENKGLVTVLTIIDEESWCDKQPEYLFQSGDLQGIVQNLWSLCDWEIAARFVDGYTYRLDMLNSINQGSVIIEKTDETVSGFSHKLTFYH